MHTLTFRLSLVTRAIAALAFAAAVAAPTAALAQVAGGIETTTESTRPAMGWSVRKTLLGKAIYNEAGQKVGKVEDLIITPERSISTVIIAAGGFIGLGQHDVAIPITQIQDKSGRLVMAGATRDSIKAMPAFTYASDTAGREAFIAQADKEIARGKARVAQFEKQAGAAQADAKADLVRRMDTLQVDVQAAEAKVDQMKRASAARWKEFQTGVTEATARLRKSVDAAAG